jgi:hypothetical protein
VLHTAIWSLTFPSGYSTEGEGGSIRQAEAGEAIKAYLADSRAKSRTIGQFQTQQLAMANNPRWVAYNERFAEGLRLAGMPE